MASRFGSHIKWWFFIVPIMCSVMLPIVPDRSLFDISDAESQSSVKVLGEERAGAAVTSTNALFRKFFVDTGAIQATMHAGGASEIDADGSRGFVQNWVRQFWMLVYRALYRALVMKAWLAGTVVLCIAAYTDGAMQRKIRASAAGFASPLSFHLAVHGLLMVVGAAFAVLVLPVPLVAQCWTLVAICLPLLLWVASSST